MSIRQIISSILIVFLFNGCYSTGLKIFHKDAIFEKGFQYTKKADLVQNHQVKLMMIATYLNPVDKKYKDNRENLIVGIYFSNSDVDEKNYIKRGYDFNITNAQDIQIKKLSRDDKLLVNLPLKNSWADYYRLSYIYDDSNETKSNRDKVIIKLENNSTKTNIIKITFDRLL